MNGTKKVLSVFLSVLLVLSFAVLPAGAEEAPQVTLVSPSGTVTLHTELQSSYLADSYKSVADYADGQKELSRPLPVTFSWTDSAEHNGYTLEISENEDFDDALTYSVSGDSCEIYNLKTGTEYFYRVSDTAGTVISGTGCFETENRGPRNLYVSGVTNVRDIGGYTTSDGGTVKQGMIYRCGRLSTGDNSKNITAKGITEMREILGVRTEIDLRLAVTGENGAQTGSVLGEDVEYYTCPMDYHGTFLESNQREDNPAALRKLFTILSDETKYPLCYHCSIGTDRTGFVSYILEGLFGMNEEDMLRDYLFSNFGNIGGSRSISSISSKYPLIFKAYHGRNLSDKIYNYLTEIVGVPSEQIDAVIAINKAPASAGDNDPIIAVDPNPANGCSHICHSDSAFLQFIWKIVLFFSKLFNINRVCECGALHY